MNRTDLVDLAGLRSDVPDFRPGDTVRVHVKVTEGNRSRIQVYEGDVIARRGSGIRETFTVRKISFNAVGVERTDLRVENGRGRADGGLQRDRAGPHRVRVGPHPAPGFGQGEAEAREAKGADVRADR